MRRLGILIFLLVAIRLAWAAGSDTIPPVTDVGTPEDVRRDIRHANEKVLPTAGGDTLFYRDIKSNQIGIGTTSPACVLDVVGSSCFDTVTGDTVTFTKATITNATITTSTTTNATITAITGLTSLNSTFLGLGRNRVINGEMVLDQRNEMASVLVKSSAALTYTVDRWAGFGQNDGAFTVQQTTTSSPLTAYPDYMRVTVTTADASISASQQYSITQRIEGYNVRDFLYGSTNAVTATLSFWVRCSSAVTTLSGSFEDSATNRAYPFIYSVNTANTWEQKTITFTGDTTGTWVINNGIGLQVIFDLGSGTSVRSSSATWQAGNFVGVTNATSLIASKNLTWDLTGVQLEIGSVASNYEYRDFRQLLQDCQRYYEKSYDIGTALGTSTTVGAASYSRSGGASAAFVHFAVYKRADPTVTSYSTTGASGKVRDITAGSNQNSAEADQGMSGFSNNAGLSVDGDLGKFQWTAESEL